MSSPYQILTRTRRGLALSADDLAAVVAGASDGSWTEGELAAFLMAAAIRGLDPEETLSGLSWRPLLPKQDKP